MADTEIPIRATNTPSSGLQSDSSGSVGIPDKSIEGYFGENLGAFVTFGISLQHAIFSEKAIHPDQLNSSAEIWDTLQQRFPETKPALEQKYLAYVLVAAKHDPVTAHTMEQIWHTHITNLLTNPVFSYRIMHIPEDTNNLLECAKYILQPTLSDKSSMSDMFRIYEKELWRQYSDHANVTRQMLAAQNKTSDDILRLHEADLNLLRIAEPQQYGEIHDLIAHP